MSQANDCVIQMSEKRIKSGRVNPWVILLLSVLLLVAVAASCLF